MELSSNREYEIRGTKLAIFTYEGATVMLRGRCEVEYLSEETSSMQTYLNTHLALEGLRQEAADTIGLEPRVIVVGTSRTTVTRLLLNYAIRAGRTPMYVDLDVTNGTLSMPGVMGAQVLDKLIDLEESILVDSAQSCLYYFGALNPSDNSKLYRRLVSRLSFSVNARLASMNDPMKSGAIVCAPAAAEEFISELQEQFKAKLVLVVGNERLHSTINKSLKGRDCTVLKLSKSGGVVQKDPAFRASQSQWHFHRYFYGPRQEYSPFTIILPFDEVHIRRLGEDTLAPKSALPLGATRKIDESKAAAKIEPSLALLYSILAVSWAKAEEQLADCNVAGFIYMYAAWFFLY